jgi:hypothetical protein
MRCTNFEKEIRSHIHGALVPVEGAVHNINKGDGEGVDAVSSAVSDAASI